MLAPLQEGMFLPTPLYWQQQMKRNRIGELGALLMKLSKEVM
jgi:hypothetical protein